MAYTASFFKSIAFYKAHDNKNHMLLVHLDLFQVYNKIVYLF